MPITSLSRAAGVAARIERWRQEVASAVPLVVLEDLPWVGTAAPPPVPSVESEFAPESVGEIHESAAMGSEFAREFDDEINKVNEVNASNEQAAAYLAGVNEEIDHAARHPRSCRSPDIWDVYDLSPPSSSRSTYSYRPPSPTLSWEVERALSCEGDAYRQAAAEHDVAEATIYQAGIDESVENAVLTWDPSQMDKKM
ncbi:uncharacterized protein PHACADRAFT_202519 [Phanerochaete carnosa HHB-10118-sp]|uniref:Uncharacterized protein n=1 Tax=Phanerochaete carnosa (strain HHB-10118-sp) TaxID=650164 RepID=K5VQ11_PHACS|nr:uncharacterized protein PHACADRAFT_202519 [Phanerochaete carnosa HHB-10118-sp]EKM48684.1 hypothetical protein PHACADRAFT_202519 [Phanerochaete carnosa HHB-10118-sp]